MYNYAINIDGACQCVTVTNGYTPAREEYDVKPRCLPYL